MAFRNQKATGALKGRRQATSDLLSQSLRLSKRASLCRRMTHGLFGVIKPAEENEDSHD
jgi:hypothetical protein